jgi:ankyrin repeat protein
MPRLFLATSNPGKLREYRQLLDGCGWELVTPAELGFSLEIEESGQTYAENATMKALAYAKAGGLTALADDSEALANAAAEGQDAFVRLMLRYQPDLAKRIAVGAKTRELTEFLFQHGMDPSQPDWLRITPLHQFARKGDLEKAALFIDHGADLHARDEDICSTPLGWAAKFGKTLMIEFLLSRGADVNVKDDMLATALLQSAALGKAEFVALLLDHGAQLNAQEELRGWSALICAAG